jgi:hypothetical protein
MNVVYVVYIVRGVPNAVPLKIKSKNDAEMLESRSLVPAPNVHNVHNVHLTQQLANTSIA